MSGSEEPRYTLDEARRELAREECARFGHSWDVIETMRRPEVIRCGRCGKAYRVGEEPCDDE